MELNELIMRVENGNGTADCHNSKNTSAYNFGFWLISKFVIVAMAYLTRNFRLFRNLGNNVSTIRHLAAKREPNIPVANPKAEIRLSETCVKRLKEICTDGTFLRITIEGGGCSGFQYKFDIDNKLQSDDKVYQVDNAKVVVDEVSLDYCKGSIIDYHTELIRAGFRIVGNPVAEQGCSCGASFSIKID